jgi:hypothetical protein
MEAPSIPGGGAVVMMDDLGGRCRNDEKAKSTPASAFATEAGLAGVGCIPAQGESLARAAGITMNGHASDRNGEHKLTLTAGKPGQG